MIYVIVVLRIRSCRLYVNHCFVLIVENFPEKQRKLMPRPRDLPRPVREHPPHENLLDKWKAASSPGPGRYVLVDPRESKLTSFPKSKRFPKGSLVPGDFRTSAERANALDVPGPKYNPTLPKSNVTASHTTAPRFSSDRTSEAPGPGEYQPQLDWNKGVSIAKAPRSVAKFAEHAPTCTTYNPELPKRHLKGGKFGRDASSHFKRTATSRSRDDCPKMSSLESMDRAMNYTKLPFNSCTFGTANRFGKRNEGFDVGPGAYNDVEADKARWRPSRTTRFSSAPRVIHHRADESGGFVGLPDPAVESQYSASPSVGFTKSEYKKGIPNPADTSVPAAKYDPKLNDDKGKIHTTFGTAPKMGSTNVTDGPGPAPSKLEIPSTLGGPKIQFGSAPRNRTSFRELVATAPGPGTYSIRDRRRPDSAGQSFTKSRRPDVRVQSGARGSEGVPGPKYNVDVSPTRPRLVPDVAIHRSERRLGDPNSARGVSNDGSYTPTYGVVDKRPRSAILYLTG